MGEVDRPMNLSTLQIASALLVNVFMIAFVVLLLVDAIRERRRKR